MTTTTAVRTTLTTANVMTMLVPHLFGEMIASQADGWNDSDRMEKLATVLRSGAAWKLSETSIVVDVANTHYGRIHGMVCTDVLDRLVDVLRDTPWAISYTCVLIDQDDATRAFMEW